MDALHKRVSNFDDYQDFSKRTLKNYPPEEYRLALLDYTLGLAGEAGEVVEIVKKGVFHGHDMDMLDIAEELGDVLFYVAAICTTIGYSLGDVASLNVAKLKQRYPKGFTTEDSIKKIDEIVREIKQAGLCLHCRSPLPFGSRANKKFCSLQCRRKALSTGAKQDVLSYFRVQKNRGLLTNHSYEIVKQQINEAWEKGITDKEELKAIGREVLGKNKNKQGEESL